MPNEELEMHDIYEMEGFSQVSCGEQGKRWTMGHF